SASRENRVAPAGRGRDCRRVEGGRTRRGGRYSKGSAWRKSRTITHSGPRKPRNGQREARAMMLPRISIKRPVLTVMMNLALILFGAISLTRLPVRELP